MRLTCRLSLWMKNIAAPGPGPPRPRKRPGPPRAIGPPRPAYIILFWPGAGPRSTPKFEPGKPPAPNAGPNVFAPIPPEPFSNSESEEDAAPSGPLDALAF